MYDIPSLTITYLFDSIQTAIPLYPPLSGDVINDVVEKTTQTRDVTESEGRAVVVMDTGGATLKEGQV